MKKKTLIIIGAVLVGAMLLGGDKEETVEAEPVIVETPKEEVKEVKYEKTEKEADNGENYNNWINSGLEEVLNHEKRLDELYTELSGMDALDVKGLGQISEQIKSYYVKSVKLGMSVDNKTAKKELEEVVSYASTQGMTLSDAAKAAAKGEWEKFTKSNSSFIEFREGTRIRIKDIILKKKEIINHSLIKKYEEIYDEKLEIVKTEAEEGVTQVEEIKKTISDEYGAEALKGAYIEGEILNIEAISKNHESGKEIDEFMQSMFIADHGDIVADMVKQDVKTVIITLYSEDDKVKSEATLETSQITKSEYGKYWEESYIEDNLKLGEYFK